MTPATSAMSVRGLSRSFGDVQALDKVSFEVPAGSIFGVIGPNGAGKTTLFSIAAGFLHADSGSVNVLGTSGRTVSHLRGRFSILPQDAQFQRNIPIIDQLTFFRMLEGRSSTEARREVHETLAKVGLTEHHQRSIHSLSHGMLKRLGIAQAFLGDPELIILDEPTSGLDPKGARQIRDLVVDLRSRATVVISSHNLLEVQEICDHVAVLDHGKLIRSGPIDEIIGAGRELRLELSRPLTSEEQARFSAMDGINGIQRETGESHRYAVALSTRPGEDGSDEILGALLRSLLDAGVTPRSVSHSGSLEAVFLRLTSDSSSGPT